MKPVRPIKAKNTSRVRNTPIAPVNSKKGYDPRGLPTPPLPPILAVETKELLNAEKAPRRRPRPPSCRVHNPYLRERPVVRFVPRGIERQQDSRCRPLAELARDLEPAA